ncbi:hypothetical protein Hypma_007477 [Hypsizygus marmoreus]|uniref:Protein kinase domain-containing protein n=1 Tax=Hypsizygus marmoreus TaxID=39966 RepID=A0A369JV39_HYPMA|nr:hypothetical protein Hypma_007477 [Hypsizygus marmoreus]
MAEERPHTPQQAENVNLVKEGQLQLFELFWRDHQPWLKEKGYNLRARYQPGWIASWKTDPQKNWTYCEDGLTPPFHHIMDATRDDGTFVALKRVKTSKHPTEVAIGQLFSSEPLASHPQNHCIPILDVLQVPDDDDMVIIVMPFLYSWDAIPFATVGEVVEFVRQLFEGLNLIHQNHIAHRDFKENNVMGALLPLYRSRPHPASRSLNLDFTDSVKVRYSRTRRPIKYYILDFDLAKQYKPEDLPYLEIGGWGGDKSVPEFQAHDDALCDPFPVDVFCAGNIIRRNFLEGSPHAKGKKGLSFMQELITDMVKDDPKARPTMDQVVTRFDDVVRSLSSWKLRSRVANVDEPPIRGVMRSVGHWTRQLGFMARRTPAIPGA